MSDENTQEYKMPWLEDSDDIPVYDEDDADGDRREFLDDPEHPDIKDLFPDEEPGQTIIMHTP